MKYPQLVSTPAVVKEWLEAELEGLGIDSTAYARTVLSLLTRDTSDPAEVIQSGYVIVANKFGRGGPAVPVSRQEEQKRAEVIECLRSASEDQGGIRLLVDQLISMLKQLPPAQSERAAAQQEDSPCDQPAPGCEDPVLRYEAAFPALRRPTGVISLTYFSRLSGGPGVSEVAAATWDRPARRLPPPSSVWPTALNQRISLYLRSDHPDDALDTLDTLPLRLRPGYGDSEPDLDPDPDPEPHDQPAATEAASSTILPSTETHFQPIRRVSGGAEDASPATYEARLYRRSDSGGLYLQDEADSAAQPPQKYMVYQGDEPPGRGLAPKFKLSLNEKCCQTDDDEEVASLTGSDAAERDLLQLLVSDEQVARPRSVPGAGDDDDSGYEVLSSLQATLNSIYEDCSDAAADSEPEVAAPSLIHCSAFARVSGAPAGHRPLYLRGGGADSLLAAVYTDVAWRPEDAPSETDHRPLYARQPAAGATAGYAEYGLLSSGRISGAVYQQGPTEYPALRYQLAGGGLPEVTFCQLANNTASVAGGRKDDTGSVGTDQRDSRRSLAAWLPAADTALWDAADTTVDVLLWTADGPPDGDVVLWQVRDTAAHPSLDTSAWESGRSQCEHVLSEECPWSTATAEPLEVAIDNSWEAAADVENPDTGGLAPGWQLRATTTGSADTLADVTCWDLGGQETAGDGSLWESRDEDTSVEDAPWEPAVGLPADGSEKTLWASRIASCAERTHWDAVGDCLRQERPQPLPDTVLESASSAAEPPPDSGLWEPAAAHDLSAEELPRWSSCAEMVERQWSADTALWEPAWEDGLIQPPPDHVWRGHDEKAEVEANSQMRRLLLRLGGSEPFTGELTSGQTAAYSEEELASRHAAWEFIDENNVKNKIKLAAEDECPLAGEGEGEAELTAWQVLPALRQLTRCLSLEEGRPLPDSVPLKAWALEEQWRRDDAPRRPARERRARRSDRKRPCAYFLEGNCKRTDCKFSHDLSTITCVFWEESGCFKGATCPFLHGYPPEDDDDEEDAESSDSAKRIVPKKTFKLEKEDFPSLHNTKKLRRTDDEEGRRAGRRGCRRHKSFSDASLAVATEPELHRTTLGSRGKRRRHHSKSEGVRPADAGARRP